jgi:alpha-amylase/alpha-mannosidase (GH57 family)
MLHLIAFAHWIFSRVFLASCLHVSTINLITSKEFKALPDKIRHAFCVHGHFYQPPREDPITGEIPLEPGAAPYRNWNERINDHCYRPNAQLRNFEHISFDLGPTLASWLESADPITYNLIIEQVKQNVDKYGVSNAMAQSYNHTILPLSSREDKITQVRWGIDDFVYRFGHKPDGMWLPETAVDLETLNVLVEQEIKFTILAPWQADKKNLDVSVPYTVKLNADKNITVFFYDQDLSTRVSFDPGATANADLFVQEILATKFNNHNTLHDQLFTIASDGEAYGHHHAFRDKFLAYLVGNAVKESALENTFPAFWLQDHSPQHDAKIAERTSWSCMHQLKRWSGECACTPNSEWKSPLRVALDRIGEGINEQYVQSIRKYSEDPWGLRHDFISVINKQEKIEDYIKRHIKAALQEEDIRLITLLLSAQFERQRMYTSCGWFFDDFDRIEPRNNVAFAAQAVWLTYEATGVDLTEESVGWLKKVKSWRSGLTGDVVFRHHMQRLHDRGAEVRESLIRK